MKFYQRQPDEVQTVINRCYFDADHGRVSLGLARLDELGREFPGNAHIAYAEGQIRRDYLGQGLAAGPLFERAHEIALAQNLRTETQWFSTCNLVQLAAKEADWRRWIGVARSEKGANQPECRVFANMLNHVDEGTPFHEMVTQAAAAAAETEGHGLAAALTEVGIQAWPRLAASQEVILRKQRAMSLRQLDMAAAQRRESLGEAFPADERLALQTALEDLRRAIVLDEYDPVLWNYESAWRILLKDFDGAIRCADQAIALRPKHYPRPLINKAQALWEVKRHAEALACARAALEESQGSDLPPDVAVQSRELIRCYEAGPQTADPAALGELAGQIIGAAKHLSDEELGQMRGCNLASIVKRLLDHCRSVSDNPIKGYVPMMADLLACFSAETALCATVEAFQHNRRVTGTASAALSMWPATRKGRIGRTRLDTCAS